MQNLTEKQQEKYTARTWLLVSPEGRYHGIYTSDKAVSMKWILSHFKGGWNVSPLFPQEKKVAEGKAMRAGVENN